MLWNTHVKYTIIDRTRVIACLLPVVHVIIPDFFFLLSYCLLGIFIYPLEENSIVVGFESMISSQIITLQIKDKAKIEDCYLDCCNTSNGALQGGSGKVGAALINFVILAMDQIAIMRSLMRKGSRICRVNSVSLMSSCG